MIVSHQLAQQIHDEVAVDFPLKAGRNYESMQPLNYADNKNGDWHWDNDTGMFSYISKIIYHIFLYPADSFFFYTSFFICFFPVPRVHNWSRTIVRDDNNLKKTSSVSMSLSYWTSAAA